MTSLVIRPAVKDDYPAILELNESLVHFLSPMDEAKLSHLHEESELLYVAELSGNVEAFALCIREGKDYDSVNYTWFSEHYPQFLYVDRIVVSNNAQGKGLGAALYKQVINHAQETGVSHVTAEIDILPPNPGSLVFHEKFGFKEVGQQAVAGGKKRVSLQAVEIKAED